MKILAIESSGLTASAAVFENEIITAKVSSNFKKTHSETLLPMIDEVIKMTGSDISEFDAIAVSGGPGSFTGLRIGGTTAKGLALAAEKPVIHVPTLDAMAYNLNGCKDYICPIMDARRGQVYTGLYRFENGRLSVYMAGTAMDINELTEYIKHRCGETDVIFLGDGVPVYKNTISENLGKRASFASANVMFQCAGSIALLGSIMYNEGKLISADDFVPDYLRQSQAEREYTEISQALSDEDINIIAGMEKEVFPDAWSFDSVKKLISGKCYGGLIARHNGKPCGYILYQKVAGEGELLRIAVNEKYRRCGIARRLMTVMEEDPDTDFWSLEVRSGNTPAIKLYEAMNYKSTRIRQDYYSDPVEDAVIMEHKIRG